MEIQYNFNQEKQRRDPLYDREFELHSYMQVPIPALQLLTIEMNIGEELREIGMATTVSSRVHAINQVLIAVLNRFAFEFKRSCDQTDIRCPHFRHQLDGLWNFKFLQAATEPVFLDFVQHRLLQFGVDAGIFDSGPRNTTYNSFVRSNQFIAIILRLLSYFSGQVSSVGLDWDTPVPRKTSWWDQRRHKCYRAGNTSSTLIQLCPERRTRRIEVSPDLFSDQ